jgi:hypothetical protein
VHAALNVVTDLAAGSATPPPGFERPVTRLALAVLRES